MRYLILFLVFTVVCISGSGQDFRGSAELPKVSADGFYRVMISPEMTTHLNENLTNIRIVDSNGTEVPYLMQVEKPMSHSLKFRAYEILEKTQTKNCCTTIILHNPSSDPINNISLSIKNAEVTKQATLLGSDNKTDWFALKERFSFNSINNREQISEVRLVDFPLSNYLYYKVLIDDSTSAPINILGAGYFEVTSESGKYTELPVNFERNDDAQQKQTHIKIKLDTTHVIDKISLKMKGAPYFLRMASISEEKVRRKNKSETETYLDKLATVELSSKGASVLNLNNTKINELHLIIENEDNPPIQVDEIKVFQLNRYLAAYLQKNETYSVKIGAPDLRAPVYDIGYFKDSIPDNVRTLKAAALKMTGETSSTESTTIFSNKLIIWIAIIAVIVVLGFMAWRMINETTANKN